MGRSCVLKRAALCCAATGLKDITAALGGTKLRAREINDMNRDHFKNAEQCCSSINK